MIDGSTFTVDNEYQHILRLIKNANTVFWSMYIKSMCDRLDSQWYTKRLEVLNG